MHKNRKEQEHMLRARTKPTRLTTIAVLLTVALIAIPAAAAPQQELTDQNISDAIEDELLFSTAVPSNRIDVETTDRIPTLTGTVSNILAKQRAGRLAETVKGVRTVINRIKVQPDEDRSDATIRNDVIAALAYDPAADSYELDVSVEDGVVTLEGTVQSWQEKRLSMKVAKGVKGVKALKDAITVSYKQDRSDAEIAAEVRKTLKWDALVDHALITVDVNNRKVTLEGTVGSAAERRQARYDAWVVGVKDVNAEDLKVRDWAKDDQMQRKSFPIKSSEEIKDAIKDALVYDPRAFSFNIDVDVAGSAVTLRGKVDNMLAKRAAEQVARRTTGVTAVTNRIKVRPDEELSDDEIAANVRKALLRDPVADRFEITVSVVDKTAYLYGDVDTYYEKSRANDAAATAEGVTNVRNQLDVEYVDEPMVYDPYVAEYNPYTFDWYDYEPYYTFETDSEIKDDIQDELWWSPFVDEDQVDVSVDNGVATLKGTVDTYAEREAARENAYEGGATWVVDKLKIKDN
jgi:osmotically-inducible protein OsmY